MNPTRISLLAVIGILLLLSGCELVGFVVSQEWQARECGEFGLPPDLNDGNPGMNAPDWAEWAIATLAKYEHKRNPELLFGLAYAYLRRSAELGEDPSLDRRAIDLLTLSALCGEGRAASLLGGAYIEGMVGVEKDPELGACLKEVYDPEMYEREIIPGRVWACGLRIEGVQQ